MTALTHFLHRARAHPVGIVLGGAAGAAVHRWLTAGSDCATTLLHGCTPRPSGTVAALIVFVAVGMILGVIVVATLRDRPGS